MPRSKRAWISQEFGSYHIISRTVKDCPMFTNREKDQFLYYMKKFSSGYFVKIHAFCIMGNHFHIMLSGREEEAEQAVVDDLTDHDLDALCESAELGHAAGVRTLLEELRSAKRGAPSLLDLLEKRLDRFDMGGIVEALEATKHGVE